MLKASAQRRIKKFILWIEICFILVLGAGLGVALGAFYQMNQMLPPDSALDAYRPPVGTKIYSADGKLLALLADENREPVKLDEVPKRLKDAVIAIEDSRFYKHRGLDFRGLARAVWTNLNGQEMSQGGSTITQQLARNIFLSPKKTLSRKMKEILIAVQIERNWTKRQILEAYLNQVYFGSGAYGVKAAASTYFGKSLKDLTLEEAALLAGLPQRPTELSPYYDHKLHGNYDRSQYRRNLVLDRMADLGFVSRGEADVAKKKDVKLAAERPRTVGYFRAHHFVQYVVDQLRDKQGYDEDIIDKSGMTIYTTLNWKMQQAAEQATASQIQRYGRSMRVSEAALVSVDPHTGYIKALVGSVRKPFEKFQFDCATQARRQPGSSFKTFVYAAALESGDSVYSSVNAKASIRMPDGKWYTPNNAGRSAGYMSYLSAFQNSVNGAAVNVCVKVSPKKVKELAQKLGIKSDMRAYPSLALGTSEVTPLEMAAAYGVFPNHGKYVEPTAITRIVSQEGEVLQEVRPKVTDSGMKPETIAGVDMLTRAVVTGGTGRAAGIVKDAHGKTGTTEDHTDVWFVGYTPDLSTAVWAGNRDNKKMARAFGGTIAAPIWARFMKEATAMIPAKSRHQLIAVKPNFKVRGERRRRERRTDEVATNTGGSIRVSVCSESGMLAAGGCPGRHAQEFVMGEQPLSRCPLHGSSRRSEPESTREDKPAVEAPPAPTPPPDEPPPPDPDD